VRIKTKIEEIKNSEFDEFKKAISGSYHRKVSGEHISYLQKILETLAQEGKLERILKATGVEWIRDEKERRKIYEAIKKGEINQRKAYQMGYVLEKIYESGLLKEYGLLEELNRIP